jgi:hypothetical protein
MKFRERQLFLGNSAIRYPHSSLLKSGLQLCYCLLFGEFRPKNKSNEFWLHPNFQQVKETFCFPGSHKTSNFSGASGKFSSRTKNTGRIDDGETAGEDILFWRAASLVITLMREGSSTMCLSPSL